jgi:hypothetical protein
VPAKSILLLSEGASVSSVARAVGRQHRTFENGRSDGVRRRVECSSPSLRMDADVVNKVPAKFE